MNYIEGFDGPTVNEETSGYKGFTNWDTWEAHDILSSFPHVYSEAQALAKRSWDFKGFTIPLIQSTISLMGLSPGHMHLENVNFEELKTKLKG